MKKFVVCLMATCMSLTFIPLQLIAGAVPEPTSSVVATPPKPAESAEAQALLLRLDEINAMDKTTLNAAEKKNLRKEAKTIKHKLREVGGGVYLSVGAIIIIALLLIILL